MGQRPYNGLTNPIEKELSQWKGMSAPSRTSNPIAGSKREFPMINTIFRKFGILPAIQNADERLISHGWKDDWATMFCSPQTRIYFQVHRWK